MVDGIQLFHVEDLPLQRAGGRIHEIGMGIRKVHHIGVDEKEEGSVFDRTRPGQSRPGDPFGSSFDAFVVILVNLETLAEAEPRRDVGAPREGRRPVSRIPEALRQGRVARAQGTVFGQGAMAEGKERSEKGSMGWQSPWSRRGGTLKDHPFTGQRIQAG